MGLFGGNDGEDDLQKLREQIDEIQSRQNSIRPDVPSQGDAALFQDMAGDTASGTDIAMPGTRSSPFLNPGANNMNLDAILRQAQLPVPQGQPGQQGQQMPNLGLPGIAGPGQQPAGAEEDELLAVLRQLGGMPQGGFN